MNVLIACEFSGIVDYPGYRLTANGRIQSLWQRGTREFAEQWRDLRPHPDKKGYLGLTICNENKRRRVRLHRLIAEAFIPNPDRLPCVRHIDGDCKNNSVANLAWCNYTENENDKKRHGTWNTRITNSKLTLENRQDAINSYKNGESQKSIAFRLKVSRPTITRLLNGNTWGYL